MKTRFLNRPLSHSQLSAWEYSPEQWYRSYILNERTPPNLCMSFGAHIGDLLGTKDTPIPELRHQGIKEYTVAGEVEGIKMIGHIDGWDDDNLTLHENKTTDNPTRWTQRKANSHTQIDMYLLLLLQQDGIPPESVTCYLHDIRTRQVGLGYQLPDPVEHTSYLIRTKTIDNLDAYTEYLLATVEKMHEYILEREQQEALSTPAPTAPAFHGVWCTYPMGKYYLEA